MTKSCPALQQTRPDNALDYESVSGLCPAQEKKRFSVYMDLLFRSEHPPVKEGGGAGDLL